MKTPRILAVFACVIALAGAVTLAQSGQDLFQKALVKERTEGNLEEAIAIYRQIVTQAGSDRALAARALVQIGQCYEKLGNTEAQKAYRQVVRDYADQAEQATLARARLAALAGATAGPLESTMAIRRVPSGNAGQALDMSTKPSPDGKYLAHVDWKTGNLAALELATGVTRLLTKDGAWGDVSQYAYFSAWSRDSKRIAYQWSVDAARQSRSELRIISVDGSTPPKTLATSGAVALPIEWTRDGSRVLCFVLQASARDASLALVPLDGGEPEKLNIDLRANRWGQGQLTGDDSAVLYSSPADGKAAPHDIYMRNLRTGAITAVVEHPAEDLLVGVIPGSDWLLFASNRRGHLDLWAVTFREGKASGAPVLVKQGVGRFLPLGFTDDGRWYFATVSVTDDVFLADFDPDTGRIAGPPRKLESQWEGANMGASFSSAGGHLAYVTKRGPLPLPTHTADSLVVQSVIDAKSDPVVVGFEEFGLTRVAGPCWADDGRSIVLGGFQDQDGGLFRVELSGLKKRQIYSLPEGQLLSGHACARGGPFAYLLASTADGSAVVSRVDMAGGTATELGRVPAAGPRITFAASPDGQTLSIITMLDQNRRALLLMPSEGGTPRRIHEFAQPTGGFVTHTWSPDGKSIYYVVMGAKPDQGTWHWVVRKVPVDGEKVSEQAFDFTGPFFSLAFHPNGRLVAFTGRSGASDESEVWVIENLRNELRSLLPKAGAKR